MEKTDVLTIKIYDGLFNSHLLKSLFSYTDNISWQFGSEYTDDDPFSMKFWGFPIMTDNDLFISQSEVIPDKISKCDKIIQETWNILNSQTEFIHMNLHVNTIILNGVSYGQEGGIHVDHGSEHPNAGDGNYTAIIYLNREWTPSCQGETILYNIEGTEITKAIIPKPGRMLLFDSRIPHQARPPHRSVDDLRITMAFHLSRH